MLSVLILAASVAASPGAAISEASEVQVPGREVRLADVARLHGVDDAQRALLNGRLIARLPEGRTSVTLGRDALAGLVRRSVPGLSIAAGAGTVTIRTSMPKPAVPARRDPPPVAAADIERGDALTLMSRAGPVRIERKVVAMQPGRHGRRLFVRDEDGAVSSIPLHVRPEAKR